MKKWVLAFTLGSWLAAGSCVHAESPSDASATASLGASLITGSVVAGSVQALAGTSRLVVTGIEKGGEGSVVVLKNLADGSVTSVRLGRSALGAASVAVGTMVTVGLYASGLALYVAGKVFAYIPNEVGRALLHSKKTSERGLAS